METPAGWRDEKNRTKQQKRKAAAKEQRARSTHWCRHELLFLSLLCLLLPLERREEEAGRCGSCAEATQISMTIRRQNPRIEKSSLLNGKGGLEEYGIENHDSSNQKISYLVLFASILSHDVPHRGWFVCLSVCLFVCELLLSLSPSFGLFRSCRCWC